MRQTFARLQEARSFLRKLLHELKDQTKKSNKFQIAKEL